MIMTEYASVLIEKDALPSFQESIEIGKEVLERKLSAYENKIAKFESSEKMDTDTFNRLFNEGKLGDNKKWFKWDHLASVVKLLNKKLHDLEKIRYEA